MDETLDVEYELIGVLCREPGVIRIASMYLSPGDFASAACAVVFKAALEADREGKLFDGYIAAKSLEGQLENPRSFIADCMNLAVTTANAEAYAVYIREKADERNIRYQVADALATKSGSALVEELAAICSAQIKNRPDSRMKSMAEVAEKTFMRLYEEPKERIHTGYRRLDSILKGMSGGNLIIIAARPAVGKSAFGWSIAENAARQGKTVQVYTMEMQDVELGYRAFARASSELTMNDIIDRSLGSKYKDDQKKQIDAATAYENLATLPIYIDDSVNVKPSKIRAQALAQKGLGLIVVDYVGLMSADADTATRDLEIGSISRSLKNLAKELNIPIVMLAQLNRNVDDSKKPDLKSLRDSGNLEQDANKIMFLWNVDKNRNIVGVSVAKNREGGTGEVQMYFDGPHMRYEELDRLHVAPSKKGWINDDDE